MRFAQPAAFWLLFLLLGIVLLWCYGKTRRAAFLCHISDPILLRQTPSRFPRLQQPWLSIVLILLPFLCTVFALADPRSSLGEPHLRRGSLDVMLLLDVSKSMAAEDYGTRSRLDKALQIVQQLLLTFQGNRVGIVTYAGTSFRQAHLTEDLAALEFILTHWITTDAIGVGGSNLVEAIETGLSLFRRDSERERLMILFSDGGTSDADLRSALTKAASLGVKILTLGLGGDQPSRIPRYDSDKQFVGYVELDGRVVTSRLDEEILRRIAANTKGTYVRIRPGHETQNLLSRSGTVSSSAFQQDEYKLFQPFLLAGLLAFGTQALFRRL